MTSPTVVVGAGPAGLAVAARLGRGDVAHELLEQADSVGAAWRTRADSLRLHTIRWLSGLPGAAATAPTLGARLAWSATSGCWTSTAARWCTARHLPQAPGLLREIGREARVVAEVIVAEDARHDPAPGGVAA